MEGFTDLSSLLAETTEIPISTPIEISSEPQFIKQDSLFIAEHVHPHCYLTIAAYGWSSCGWIKLRAKSKTKAITPAATASLQKQETAYTNPEFDYEVWAWNHHSQCFDNIQWTNFISGCDLLELWPIPRQLVFEPQLFGTIVTDPLNCLLQELQLQQSWDSLGGKEQLDLPTVNVTDSIWSEKEPMSTEWWSLYQQTHSVQNHKLVLLGRKLVALYQLFAQPKLDFVNNSYSLSIPLSLLRETLNAIIEQIRTISGYQGLNYLTVPRANSWSFVRSNKNIRANLDWYEQWQQFTKFWNKWNNQDAADWNVLSQLLEALLEQLHLERPNLQYYTNYPYPVQVYWSKDDRNDLEPAIKELAQLFHQLNDNEFCVWPLTKLRQICIDFDIEIRWDMLRPNYTVVIHNDLVQEQTYHIEDRKFLIPKMLLVPEQEAALDQYLNQVLTKREQEKMIQSLSPLNCSKIEVCVLKSLLRLQA